MSDPDFPSFQVHELRAHQVVTGRNCGTEISLTTVFTQIVLQQFGPHSQQPEFSTAITETALNPQPLAISISGIEAYEHELEELPPGMTAALKLSGTDADKLVRALDELSDDQSLALQAPPDRDS
jgi:hypothetical protein